MLLMLVTFIADVAAQNYNGSWSGTLDAGQYSLTIVFNIEQTEAGLTATWDVPEQGAYDMPVSATITGNELNVDIPNAYASYHGTFVGDTLDGTFTQYGANFPLRMTRSGRKKSIRPQEEAIKADANKPYRCEDVTFTNDGITFAGTLTLPDSGCCFPAVVLVAGSGPHDRDETVFGHKPFLLISDALSRNGFAVLRYDERGVGDTEGGDPNAPTEPLATDAMAALRYLKTRPEVDNANVGFLGHSEGGMIAIMNAAKYPNEVAFIVSMAGTGVSGFDLAMQQVRLEAKAQGEEISDEVLAISEEIFRIVATEEDSVTLRNKLLPLYENPVLKEELQGMTAEQAVDMSIITKCVIQYDPTENLKRVKCPMLAINGTLDYQVACEENLAAIKRLVPHATVKAYDGLNHFFQTCDGWVGSSQYGLFQETMSPLVLEDVTEWLKSVVKK